MSIAAELQNLNDNILDAYTAVQDKGGTVPTDKNMVNLPTAIDSIPSGGIPREIDANGVYRQPAQSFSYSLPSGVTNVGGNALSYAFAGCSSLTSVDLSSLATVRGSSAFTYAFFGCDLLASVDLSSLTTVSGTDAFSYAFSRSGLTSVDLSSLTTVSGSGAFNRAFYTCKSLRSLSFPALTASSFGSYTNQFNNMLQSCRDVTVHFPAAIQSTIGSWSSVTSGFGGTNTTVLYDL